MKQFFRNLPWKLARLEFYKKKPFAVACTVIFSVLLAFDLSIAVFVPSTNSLTRVQGLNTSDFGELMDSTEFGDMSDMQGGYPDADSDSDSGSDSSSGSDSDSSSDGMPGSGMQGAMGDMPDDFDASEMGDMPSGGFSGETGDMPSGDASGDMSGFPGNSSDGSDTDGSSGSDTDGSSDSDSDAASDSTSNLGKSSVRGSGILGFLQGVKSHWILLAVIFGILDALSITRLVILARRAKKERIEEAKLAREQMLAGEIVRTAGPAKKYKKTNPAAIWAIPMVGVLLLVVIVKALGAQSSVTVESTSATVYSGSAETTSLDTVLSGAGTLEEEDAEAMEINSSVEVSTWYVSNGDTVEEGDTLAAVDKVSVMSAIASLQEQLDELDALLEEYESEEIDDTITAASDGRVMAIYAEEDTSVIDTMYDNGSLMLLSIDGYLAVDLETDENLQAGDSVVVILSDDTELTGKVGSYVNGTAVILVSDEDASLSEEVSVETEDGEEIGSGSLYIHNELAVTGFLGTVDEISVEVGDEVESGDTLLTLTDTEYTGTYETLLAQRSELAEEMQELFTLYQDPYLYASCAGVVSGISDDSSSDSSSDDDSSDDDSDSSSDDSDSDSSDDDSSASAAEDDEVLAEAQSDAAVAVSASADAGTSETVTAASTETTTTAAASSAGAVTATATVCTVTSGTATATASTLTSSSDTTYTAVATSTSDGYDNYIGIVQSTDADSATAEVLFLTGVYQISDYSDLSDYDLSADSMTEEYTIAMSEGIIMFTYSSSNLTVESAADIAAGDILVISYESGGSPGLGSTPIWIVRVVEESSEDDSSEDSGSTESDSTADSSASGSSSGSDSSSGSSGSSGSSSGNSGSASGSDSSSGSTGSASGSDSSSGSSGSASGSDSSSGSASGSFDSSDSASGSTGSASSSDAASGNSDYGVLEGSTDSTLSDSLDFGSSDSQNSTESGTAGDSVTGSTGSSESSGSGDTTFTIDGTSSSTDLGITSSDSSGSSEDSDLSGDSSTYSSDASDISDSVSDSGGTTDITDASASGTSEESSVTNAYTVSKTTFAEITPQDTMTITITIDELDILSLEEGQTAQVTLDAFPGQSFEGEVTAIDLSGTNSGGSTKFTAEVTITREDDMLAGMNASAVITIDTTENVLCIPENALVETDGVCYVYTTYDEKNDELGGLVEVTTGLSDGESVEILSGLSEGDSYYYSILDVVNYSTFSASSGSSSFSMESLFSSGGGRGGM